MTKNIISIFILLINFNFITASENKNIYYEMEYNLIEANRLQLNGNVVESARIFNKNIRINPGDPVPYYKLSEIYSSVGSYNEAIFYAKKAYYFNPYNKWFVYNLINLYNIVNYTDSARYIVKHEQKLGRNNLLLQKGYIESLIKDGEYKKAIKHLNSLDSLDRRLFVFKIHCYNQLNEIQKSIDILKNVIDYDNSDIELVALLAESYARENDFINADFYYKKVLNREPNNTLYWLSYFDYGFLSENISILKDYTLKIVNEKSIKIQDKIYVLEKIKFANNDSLLDLRERLLKYLIHDFSEWNNDAYLFKEYLLRDNKNELAKDFLLNLIKNDNQNKALWQNLLFITNWSQKDTSIKYSEIAYQKFNNDPLFNWFYAVSLKSIKKYVEAIDIIEGFKISKIENKGLKIEFYILLAELNEILENYDEADRNFEMALINNPKNLMLKNNYSYYLSLREKNLDYALKLIKECIKEDPNNFIYLDTYGWVLYKLNKIDSAKKMIEKALKLNGDSHSEILEHYGDILFKEHMVDKAVYYWKKALKCEIDLEKKKIIENKILNKSL